MTRIELRNGARLDRLTGVTRLAPFARVLGVVPALYMDAGALGAPPGPTRIGPDGKPACDWAWRGTPETDSGAWFEALLRSWGGILDDPPGALVEEERSP